MKSNKDDTPDPIGAAFDSPALAAATSSPSAPPTSQIGTSPARTARRTFSARFSDPRSRRSFRSASPRPTRSLYPLEKEKARRAPLEPPAVPLLSPSYFDRRGNRPKPGVRPRKTPCAKPRGVPKPSAAPSRSNGQRTSVGADCGADNDNCERADVRGEAD